MRPTSTGTRRTSTAYEKCVKAAHRRHVGKKLHVVMKRVLYALHLA